MGVKSTDQPVGLVSLWFSVVGRWFVIFLGMVGAVQVIVRRHLLLIVHGMS